VPLEKPYRNPGIPIPEEGRGFQQRGGVHRSHTEPPWREYVEQVSRVVAFPAPLGFSDGARSTKRGRCNRASPSFPCRYDGSGLGNCMVSSRIVAMPENLDWKQAYMAAIRERDLERLSSLIEDATVRLAARFQELKAQGLIPGAEVETIHDASYMLEALRSSLSYPDDLTDGNP
jgi:hypothetical protein